MKKTMLSERAKMGLGPFKDYWNYVISDKIILATDPAASTVPDDVEQEWEQTGAFILPIVEKALDPKLEAFLAAGEPPVFIGLGSMPSDDPDKTTRIFAEVVQSLGRRVILYQGWANLGNLKLPDNCLVIQGAPHQLLFPRLSAIVHHGGGGTTAAAIRAGVPQVVISVLGDQHYWGYQMTRLGVSPDFIPFPKLNSKRLLEAVHKCLHSKELGLKAKKLASEVNDGGTLEAVKIIEDLAGKKFGD
jgi:UDP:flavonoid glycosyltransferase YjiC (YdhE family)